MKHDARTQAAIKAGHPEWAELPATRADALETGSARFFTGKACKHGHISDRFTASYVCVECGREKQLSPEYREKEKRYCERPDVRKKRNQYAAKYQAKPESRARQRQYRSTEAFREKQVEYRQRPHVQERERQRRLDNPLTPEQKAQQTEYQKVHRQRPDAKERHRERMRVVEGTRRAATPPWLTDAQKDEIKGFYEQAARLERETGVPHQVDHIVPLTHDLVCGWGVPWNLQVLTAAENRRKWNAFDGTMNNDGWRDWCP